MTRNAPKLQRWTDLLAALLRHRYPVPFETLRKEVPAYHAHHGEDASLMRKFERDKDELRAFGVPIETILDSDGSLTGYRLASKSFYLPYLHLVTDRRAPKRPRGPGYQGLPVLAFEPDELTAVVNAGRRVQSLGDPALAREAAAALRKLAHDLPVDAELRTAELIVQERTLDSALFDRLADAMRRRKTVTFVYHSMHRDEHSTRRADVYGMAFMNGNWYVIAHDHDAGALRNFRARRIRDLEVHAFTPQTADFAVPADFDLWEHTRSRHSWELGDAEARVVTVRFSDARGNVAEATQLGTPVAGDAACREFRVRRIDNFLRWILAFAGAARPVSPPDVVSAYDALVRGTLGRYAEAGASA